MLVFGAPKYQLPLKCRASPLEQLHHPPPLEGSEVFLNYRYFWPGLEALQYVFEGLMGFFYKDSEPYKLEMSLFKAATVTCWPQ